MTAANPDSSGVLPVPVTPLEPRPRMPSGSGWVTVLLVLVGAATTAAVAAATPDSQALTGDPLSQLDAGGADGALLRAGDWWRLVQPLFVPRHALHAAMAFFAVALLGMQLERWVSGVRLLALIAIPSAVGIAGVYLTGPASPAQAGVLVGAIGGVSVALGASQLRGEARQRLRLSLIVVFASQITAAANDGSFARGWAGPVIAFVAGIAVVPMLVPWDLRPGPQQDGILAGLGMASLAAFVAAWVGAALNAGGPQSELRIEVHDTGTPYTACQARVNGYWIPARSGADESAGLRHPGVPGSQLILLPGWSSLPDPEVVGNRIMRWLDGPETKVTLRAMPMAAPSGLADNAGIMRFRASIVSGDGPPSERVVDLVLAWDIRAQMYAEALVIWPRELADHPRHLAMLAELSRSLALLRRSV